MRVHIGPESRGENARDGNAGTPVWALNPDHYEAVLDAWLEDTSLRGKQWTGVSDDTRHGPIQHER